MKKLMAEAISTLMGTIIGAGVLSLPYAVSKSGFMVATLQLIIITFFMLLIYLMLGEICLRTKGKHQLTGYAEKYFGKPGRFFMFFSMTTGIYGALLAYIIGEGQALYAIFNISSSLFFSIVFFVIASIIVFLGLGMIRKSELFMGIFMISIILIFSFILIPRINLANLTYSANTWQDLFFPYGMILFALGGAVAIPEMKEELVRNTKLIKKCIITGVLIPAFLYLFFMFAAVGFLGKETTQVATIGLGEHLGLYMVLLGNIFAVLAMATSFLTLGLALKEMFWYDYKLNKNLAFLLTVLPPLLVFLFVEKSFAKTIGIAGGLSIGIEGILLVFMHARAIKKGERKPEFKIKIPKIFAAIIILIFLTGVVYAAWELLAWLQRIL